ncbi:MAG: transcriptional regulator, TetR family [Phenylobacterium sp.]|nr:transcriptional regulator, TetR family [Phenylobacterium sp.]
MPRIAGQIDVAKNEAILDAAVAVLTERGVTASMEQIARRAGVSKQTVYNHYGTKAELVRAMCARRVGEITAPLTAAGALEQPAEALAEFARVLLRVLLSPSYATLLRTAMANVQALPEVARTMYEAGPRASRRRLAEFLAAETTAGRLACSDPLEAADFFAGMVVSSRQTAYLLGVSGGLDEASLDRIAREAAARFLRAYAPDKRGA